MQVQKVATDSKLLIVDDNPMNIGVIADYLEEKGFRILVARDGHSALEKAEYALPDLILLDVMMPGIDGFETCRRLKANDIVKDIPVIFMTALAETSHKVEGFEAGAVDYVTKPIQQEEVLARVTTHLKLRELTEHLEQKVAERTEELSVTNKKLAKLNNAKADFMRVVSHELRTPLAIVDGFAQILSHFNQHSTEQLDDIAKNILEGTNRMSDIIGQLIDATEIELDSLNVAFNETHVAEIIEQVCENLANGVHKRNQKIHQEHLRQLPPIQGETDLLYRVFYHVIVNAIKYTPDGGNIVIRGKVIEQDHEIEIQVQDAGIGIDAEHLDLIFEKFYQTGNSRLHSSGKTSFKGGGPGLGLTIAKGIVVAHNGKIWAESSGYDEENYPGSTIFIRLSI